MADAQEEDIECEDDEEMQDEGEAEPDATEIEPPPEVCILCILFMKPNC